MGNNNIKGLINSKLKYLCSDYMEIIEHINKLGSDYKLYDAIMAYKAGIKETDMDKDIKFVLYVHRMHPLRYSKEQREVNTNWLYNVCLTQIRFCKNIEPKLKNYDFKKWFKQYRRFLALCRKYPTKVIVPTLIEDFIWHAHMQNNYIYLYDTKNIIGKPLDHDDEISEDLLQKYKKERQYLTSRTKYTDSGTSSCVVMVPGFCGGSGGDVGGSSCGGCGGGGD